MTEQEKRDGTIDPNTGRNDGGRGARPMQGEAKRGTKRKTHAPPEPPQPEIDPSDLNRSRATKQTYAGGETTP